MELLFAYSTILGWAYYGEKCVEYLLGLGDITPYRWLWTIGVMVGAVSDLGVVWDFAEP